MPSAFEEYTRLVGALESDAQLATYAKHSFEEFESSSSFINGHVVRKYYQDNLARLQVVPDPRTPLQRERDRIVHSVALRNLAQKYHVIFVDDNRITRNYIIHALRMAQIARAICRHLKLNQDFAEAIALGSKVGMIPCKHVSELEIASWAEELTRKYSSQTTAMIPPTISDFPPWVTNLPSESRFSLVSKVPVAKMANDIDRFHTSGKQSYLTLVLNPYTYDDTEHEWQKETIYGIWRHSLKDHQIPEKTNHFDFDWKLGQTTHTLSWKNDTYEAMVVRLCDDITWVIENIQDASYGASMFSKG